MANPNYAKAVEEAKASKLQKAPSMSDARVERFAIEAVDGAIQSGTPLGLKSKLGTPRSTYVSRMADLLKIVGVSHGTSYDLAEDTIPQE